MHPLILEGEDALMRGDLDTAEACFRRRLDAAPDDPDALTDLGLIHVMRDAPARARALFEHALASRPSSPSAFYNLLDLLLGDGDTAEARAVFTAHHDALPDDDEKRSYQQRLFPAPASDAPPLRLFFVCGPDTGFIEPFERALQEHHTVETLHVTGQVSLEDIQRGMDAADVTWFEWCDRLLVEASKRLKKRSAVVCRLHSYEAFTDFPLQVQTGFVDHLVFVAPHIETIVQARLPQPVASSVIYNGVDLDRLTFTARQPGFDLAYLGYINFKKNPELLLQCMADLVARDDRYHLHVAGRFQDLRYRLYFDRMIPAMGLDGHVHLDGWVDDVDAWLEDKQYLVSTSVLESFGMGIAEGMAKGLKPVIHNWPGSEHLFPEALRFNTVREFSALVMDDTYDSAAYRAWIADRYALPGRIQEVERLLREVADRHTPDPDTATSVPAAHGDQPVVAPARNLIVTGIPRSGTSLVARLLNDVPNAVCLNEVLYDLDTLDEAFATIRRRLLAGEPIPNKYNEDGTLTTNTQAEANEVAYRVPEGTYDAQAVVASKVNVPYLANLQHLLAAGYTVLAVIRDPAYTLGSWASPKAHNIPEAQVSDDNLHPRWQRFPFASDDPVERQAQIWQTLAKLIHTARDQLLVVRYEDLTADPRRALQPLCEHLNLSLPDTFPTLQSANQDDRYGDLSRIRAALERYAPVHSAFGYTLAVDPSDA